jgi:hypothetical protein
MGLTSGRGSHGGGARRRRAGSAGQDNAGHGESRYGRTSLVGGDQQETAYRSAPVGDGQRGGVSDGGYGFDASDYDDGGHDTSARNTGGYGFGSPGGPSHGGGWDGRPVGGGEQGPVTAFVDRLPAGRSRRAGRRRGAGRWLSGYSAPVISVVAIVVCAAVVAAGLGVNHILTARSAADAADNPNCTLIVPANPLTAEGLASPYQLTATDPAAGPCDEANNAQTAFVQGGILNPSTGQISIYDPLVVDAGAQPAVAPVVPQLPAGAVVALWFGYNGTTLTLAGADQNLTTGTNPTATATATDATAQAAPTTSPSGSASATTPAGSATPTGSASSAAAASPTDSASPGTSATATPTASTPAVNSAPAGTQATGAPSSAPASTSAATAGASVQSVGSAPLPPSSAGSAGWLNASLTSVSEPGAVGSSHHHHPSPSPSATTSASATSSAPTQAPTPTSSGITAPTASASATATATGGAPTDPPVNLGDAPAASPTQDTILQNANCVAGENINGQFSSFTQVGACNATAFFSAANTAIAAHKLRVPAPGTAKDGQTCLTTRSFALIDQDQSDNVTTEYLTTGNGQTAQDTAANRSSLGGSTTLFNGSDNGLLDLFVDPALACSPWEAPNLADGGALAPGLPLDELQAAAWAGRQGSGASALVPLNDPMTLDDNGNFSTDKTNTYRSLVDMPALPVGQSPAAYCSDMENIQGTRLQQDVNLLINGPSPTPAAANNLFTFLAMRLQQSFMNLNCGSFGLNNDVSTSADGNGVVVAACFATQVRASTPGQGNPMAGTTTCPATASSPTPSTSANPGHQGHGQGGQPSPSGMSRPQVQNYWHHHHHG